MHRLEDLIAKRWSPSRELPSEMMDRVSVLAEAVQSRESAADRAAAVYFVPGRIEVLGKHTDYAGGRSLVAATDQGFWLVACPRADGTVRMLDVGRGESMDFELESDAAKGVTDWTLYPKTVAGRVAQNFGPDLVGADVAFTSDLPASAGLSSSSALVVGTFLVLAGCNHLDRDPRWERELNREEQLAAYLGAIESGRSYGSLVGSTGVGTRGGGQDHTAILCSGRGEIRQFRFLPTVREGTFEVPMEMIFAVAVSGVRAKKTGGAMDGYNRLSSLAGRLERFREAREGHAPGSLGSMVIESPQDIEKLARDLEFMTADSVERRELRNRLDQFHRETVEIIPAAGSALQSRDLAEFGLQVDLSMRLATELLENQVEETVWLAAAARQRGAVAASAFGAGFGGAVWALVHRDELEGFLVEWSSAYCERFPEAGKHSRFIWTGAGGPATEL